MKRHLQRLRGGKNLARWRDSKEACVAGAERVRIERWVSRHRPTVPCDLEVGLSMSFYAWGKPPMDFKLRSVVCFRYSHSVCLHAGRWTMDCFPAERVWRSGFVMGRE